ncbi:ribonuclease P protein component [Futiania mangrovi]|uniref:Ribonuclease P protein component n=1 Tax=Futiania mangrovi TaxID=2959716 RepID=A0A9J6PM73_9PROT|nr:ribonuclease P protein component [Futiania mangrovii]MCP1337767.1 ribonuclease P protein component [Futiania mangrovii]
MLPRLKRRADFKHVAGGVRWAAPGLVLQARTDLSPPDGPRVGFTASRKVGGAVQRNRAKRRLRVLADDLIARCGRPGIAYVLIARGTTPDRDFALLRADLEEALSRVHRRLDRDPARDPAPARPD